MKKTVYYFSVIILSSTLLPQLVLAKPNWKPHQPLNENILKNRNTNLVNREIQKPNQKPNFGEGITEHERLVELRLQRLEQSERIPEEKKEQIKQDLTEELEWIKSMREKLQAITTEEERTALREEIIDHVKTQRQERRRALAETVQLPAESPAKRATLIGQHMQNISTRLEESAINTAELTQLSQDYQTAIATLEAAFQTVQTDRSIDNLKALRSAIQAVQKLTQQWRIQLQSILMQEKSVNT